MSKVKIRSTTKPQSSFASYGEWAAWTIQRYKNEWSKKWKTRTQKQIRFSECMSAAGWVGIIITFILLWIWN